MSGDSRKAHQARDLSLVSIETIAAGMLEESSAMGLLFAVGFGTL
jgi:hypothetical protein